MHSGFKKPLKWIKLIIPHGVGQSQHFSQSCSGLSGDMVFLRQPKTDWWQWLTEQKSIARRHASERTKLNTIKGEAVFVIWRRKEGGNVDLDGPCVGNWGSRWWWLGEVLSLFFLSSLVRFALEMCLWWADFKMKEKQAEPICRAPGCQAVVWEKDS